MGYLSIPNVKVVGIAASVPKNEEFVSDYPLFNQEESASFSKTTGIVSRRKAPDAICSSDLCFHAAEELIKDLDWDKNEIDCLIFVTQTPDYIIPSTAPILQSRLKLPKNCYTLDISLGCSGWVYGLSVISSLLSHGSFKKGLLLAGDTILKTCSANDKSTYPLFGDAGSATAIEFSEGCEGFKFNLMTDGSGSDVIRIDDGGFRNPVAKSSFEEIKTDLESSIVRSKLHLILEGMDVFTFGISKAPSCIKNLVEHFELELDSIDFFTLHQANRFMNENIRKKLKLPIEKVPYSIEKFGNTSCVTIPLTLATQIANQLRTNTVKHIACGFGVGLSWGSVYFETDKISVPNLVEV